MQKRITSSYLKEIKQVATPDVLQGLASCKSLEDITRVTNPTVRLASAYLEAIKQYADKQLEELPIYSQPFQARMAKTLGLKIEEISKAVNIISSTTERKLYRVQLPSTVELTIEK